MRTGPKRGGGPKDVAADRKSPRAMKQLVLAYHEDEDGNQLLDENDEPIPAVAQTFRVAPFPKTCVFLDRDLKEHRFEIEEGELDWSSGAVTVGMQYFDEDGELMQIVHLSHDRQFSHNWKKCEYKDSKIRYFGTTARSPNAYIPRFNILATGKKRAAILGHWQAMADSPDATWLDGRAPTVEEIEAANKAREEAEAAKQRGNQTDTPQPAGVTDDGEDFNEFDGD